MLIQPVLGTCTGRRRQGCMHSPVWLSSASPTDSTASGTGSKLFCASTASAFRTPGDAQACRKACTSSCGLLHSPPAGPPVQSLAAARAGCAGVSLSLLRVLQGLVAGCWGLMAGCGLSCKGAVGCPGCCCRMLPDSLLLTHAPGGAAAVPAEGGLLAAPPPPGMENRKGRLKPPSLQETSTCWFWMPDSTLLSADCMCWQCRLLGGWECPAGEPGPAGDTPGLLMESVLRSGLSHSRLAAEGPARMCAEGLLSWLLLLLVVVP